MQRAEEREKRERELRKEEMLKQRELRRSNSGAGLTSSLSSVSAGSLPSSGFHSPLRGNQDFKMDVVHVESDIGHISPLDSPVSVAINSAGSAASAVLDDTNSGDSGDECERRERQRLVQAEQVGVK